MFQLTDLIDPHPVETFLSDIYAKSWAHFPGSRERFQGLTSWGTINSVLETQRLDPPRFRVVQNSMPVPSDEYTEEVARRIGGSYRRFVPEKLLAQLRGGGTLVVDSIDQVNPSVRDLALSLESELRSRIFINAFASWMPIPGLNLHWDDHDVFVIQLEGSKNWQIHGPTRLWPHYRDIGLGPTPNTAPLVELEVEAGDVLYVPHGWWHAVKAVDGPSLHLTVGIGSSDGIDFLTWLTDRAHHDEIFRRRLPRFGNASEQAEYLVEFRKGLNRIMGTDDLLEDFFAHSDGTERGRPRFNFPDIFAQNDLLARSQSTLVLIAPRATVTSHHDGLVLMALGRRWSFPAKARPVIEALISGQSPTIEAVLSASPEISRRQAADLIFTLLKAGVVSLKDHA